MLSKKKYKIVIIVVGIIFSYWLGFTVVVPGSYWIISIYSDLEDIPPCNNFLDENKIQKYFLKSPYKDMTGFISPIDAHFLVSEVSDLTLEHIIYQKPFSICFTSDDKRHNVWMQFSFERYISA